MKHITVALLLLASPVLAQQQPPPPPVPISQDVLQHIAVYLQDGGTHNEGASLSRLIGDMIAVQQSQKQIADLTKERDELKAAKPKE